MPSEREELRFGNYELRTLADGQPYLLGKGTFGSTYKGSHIYLGEEVAIKVINARYISDTNAKERFLREARVLHAIRHPNIARVLDFGEVSAGMYFVLEFCGGGSLKDLADRVGPVPPADVFTIARQCASALGTAHRSNFIHRDIKPANIMLARPGPELDVKLIDFGLVKIMNPEVEGAGQFPSLQTQGLFTPYYASPEQIREETLDARTDLFSLGMSLLYLLVGGLPERGAAATIIASRLGPNSYDNLIPPRLPAPARQIMSRLLAKDRDERFSSAEELLVALDELARDFSLELPDQIAASLAQSESMAGEEGGLSSGEGGVATVTSGTPPLPAVADLYEIGTRRISHPLGSLVDAKRTDTADACALLLVDANHLLDPARLDEIDRAIARLMGNAHPAIAGPGPLEALRDASVIPFTPFFGMDLLSILKLRKSFRLSDILPILRQIAEGVDHAENNGLGPIRIALGEIFMRARSGGEFAGTSEIITVMPVARWPEFQAVMLPGLIRVELSEVIADTGATMQSSGDSEGRASVEFAALIYQCVSGRTPPVAARVSRTAYTAISSISEASNRLLAATLCGEMALPCVSLLDRLSAEEGISASAARPSLPVGATRSGPKTGSGSGGLSPVKTNPPGVLPTATRPVEKTGTTPPPPITQPTPPVQPPVQPELAAPPVGRTPTSEIASETIMAEPPTGPEEEFETLVSPTSLPTLTPTASVSPTPTSEIPSETIMIEPPAVPGEEFETLVSPTSLPTLTPPASSQPPATATPAPTVIPPVIGSTGTSPAKTDIPSETIFDSGPEFAAAVASARAQVPPASPVAAPPSVVPPPATPPVAPVVAPPASPRTVEPPITPAPAKVPSPAAAVLPPSQPKTPEFIAAPAPAAIPPIEPFKVPVLRPADKAAPVPPVGKKNATLPMLAAGAAIVAVIALVVMLVLRSRQSAGTKPPVAQAATPVPTVMPTPVAAATPPRVAAANATPAPTALPRVVVLPTPVPTAIPRPSEFVFEAGIEPGKVILTLNGARIVPTRDGARIKVPLGNAKLPGELVVSAPGFVPAKAINIPDAGASPRLTAPLRLERLQGEFDIVWPDRGVDYDEICFKWLEPRAQEAGFVQPPERNPECFSIKGKRAFSGRLPSGVYAVILRRTTPDPAFAPLELVSRAEIRNDARLTAKLPPSWAGRYTYDFRQNAMSGVTRDIEIDPNLRRGKVLDTAKVEGSAPTSSEYELDITGVDSSGTLSALIRASRDQKLTYWDERLELGRGADDKIKVVWGWDAAPKDPAEAARIRAAMRKRYPKGATIPEPQVDRAKSQSGEAKRLD